MCTPQGFALLVPPCSELSDQHLAHLLLIFQDSPQRSLTPRHLAQATSSLTAPHHKARNT